MISKKFLLLLAILFGMSVAVQAQIVVNETEKKKKLMRKTNSS